MPELRTNIIDVYVFREATDAAASGGVELLQLRRATGALLGTWQPVMGHATDGEAAADTALRELTEETGFALDADDDAFRVLGLWQLDEVNTYFLASHDAIVMSACFAAQVAAGAEPRLNEEHDAARWVRRDHADRAFLWPGQRAAVAGLFRDVLSTESPLRGTLRVK